jgi:hypothetical protein
MLLHSVAIQVRRPKVSIEAWRRHYDEVPPHSSLAYLTPGGLHGETSGRRCRGALLGDAARADVTKNGELRTGPISAILQ